jgi:hypothetical protein
MDIQFHGFKNIGWLERRRYVKIMYKWLEDHVSHIENDTTREYTLKRIMKFRVRFFPTTMYKKMYGEYNWRTGDTGELSDLIPHEKVGQFVIDLFILDNKDDLRMASNLIMMSHGLGHVLLYSYDHTRRTKLNVNDASGNLKGKVLAWHTAAVHNRTEKMEKTVQRLTDKEIDNQIYYLQTWRRFGLKWRKVMYRMYDFRDDLN